jgi:hypothetical protein
MIEVKMGMDLLNDTWSGGREAAKLYLKWGLLDEVEEIIDDWVSCDEEATDTTVNDILWFEDDAIAEALGYESYEALYDKMEHEEEEE